MKKSIRKILLITLLVSSGLSTLAQWRFAPSTSLSVNDIMFVNSSIGYQVGDFGYMTKTIDGGQKWTSLASRTNKDLYTVFFTSPTVGYAGGDNILIKTIDGGNTWMYYYYFSSAVINRMHFLSDSTGWICTNAGEILSTLDGGLNWSKYTSAYTFNDICFTSISNGWAVGTSGTVLKTTNGGQSWVPVSLSIPTTVDVESVEFMDSNTGWIAARNGYVYRTTNGGVTWQSNSSPAAAFLFHTSFASATVGFGATSTGVIKTSDGGASWTSSGLTTKSIYRLAFQSTTQGTIVLSAGISYTTTDGGTTWSPRSDEINYDINEYGLTFSASAPGTGWSVGERGVIRKTTDYGETWTNQSSGITSTLLGVSFPNATNGWTIGFNGVIRATTDGGTTWSGQTSGTSSNLFGVFFTSATNGIVVGDGGLILKTTDGGTTWSSVSSGTSNILRSVYFSNATNGWAVGVNGVILKTINTGATWTTQTSGTTNNLLGVCFPTNSTGYAVGLNGTILKSTDGGVSWTTQTSSTSNHLTCVSFINDSEGIAAGYNGVILKTVDGGNTWTNLDLGFTLQPLNACNLSSISKGGIVGNSGIKLLLNQACNPPAPVIYNSNTENMVCSGSNAILRGSGIGKISWWDSPTGGVNLGNGFTYNGKDGGSQFLVTGLTSTTTYYAEDFTCNASATRTAVTITINTVNPSDAISQNGVVLSSAETNAGATYQWKNCGNNFLIPGENNLNFTATENGDYGVVVSLGGCQATSSCITINSITAVKDSKEHSEILIYPNPAEDELILELTDEPFAQNNQLKIIDLSGKTITIMSNLAGQRKEIKVDKLPAGLYLMEVELNGKLYKQRFMKK